jgi:hypothetical protein
LIGKLRLLAGFHATVPHADIISRAGSRVAEIRDAKPVIVVALDAIAFVAAVAVRGGDALIAPVFVKIQHDCDFLLRGH